jgi:hypothetical protein
MRATFMAVLTILFGVASVTQAEKWKNYDTATRLEKMRAEVILARHMAGIKDPVKTIIATEHTDGVGHIAWPEIQSVANGVTTYSVRVRKRFLQDSSLMLLEHVARHEICHILRGDLNNLNPGYEEVVERDTEKCVYALSGPKVYNSYIRAYQKWQPVSSDLREARQIMINRMFQPE